MKLESLKYNETSEEYLAKKVLCSICYLVLFSVLFCASIILLVFACLKDRIEFVAVFTSCCLFIVNIMFIYYTIMVILDCKKVVNEVKNSGSYEKNLKTPYTIDLEKKYSNVVFLYFVCVCIVAVATLMSIIAAISSPSIEVTINIFLMFTILSYSTFFLVTTILDDNHHKRIYAEENGIDLNVKQEENKEDTKQEEVVNDTKEEGKQDFTTFDNDINVFEDDEENK